MIFTDGPYFSCQCVLELFSPITNYMTTEIYFNISSTNHTHYSHNYIKLLVFYCFYLKVMSSLACLPMLLSLHLYLDVLSFSSLIIIICQIKGQLWSHNYVPWKWVIHLFTFPYSRFNPSTLLI